MRAVRIVVSDADLPILGDFVLDGQIGLLREGVLKIFRDGNCEREQRERKSRRQEILIREQGVCLERIEPLLIGLVAHHKRQSRRGRSTTGKESARAAEQALENVRRIQREWVYVSEATGARAGRA